MGKKNQANKKRNPIVMFIFAVILPLILAAILAIFVLSFAGFDVTGWMKEKGQNVPVIGKMIKTDEEKDMMRKLNNALETIDAQKEQLEEYEKEIESMRDIIDELELENKKLQNRSESEAEEEDGIEQQDEVKQAAASFRKMDPEKAAPIVQNMDDAIAVEILASLSGDVRGNILAEMDPKKAAELTTLLSNR